MRFQSLKDFAQEAKEMSLWYEEDHNTYLYDIGAFPASVLLDKNPILFIRGLANT
mgnify:CR=1 FL=1